MNRLSHGSMLYAAFPHQAKSREHVWRSQHLWAQLWGHTNRWQRIQQGRLGDEVAGLKTRSLSI